MDERATAFFQRTSRYGAKNEVVVIIAKVKKGRRSYFVVKSENGHIFNVPTKYLKLQKSEIRNAIKLPVPDTSKPPIKKTKKECD